MGVVLGVISEGGLGIREILGKEVPLVVLRFLVRGVGAGGGGILPGWLGGFQGGGRGEGVLVLLS